MSNPDRSCKKKKNTIILTGKLILNKYLTIYIFDLLILKTVLKHSSIVELLKHF